MIKRVNQNILRMNWKRQTGFSKYSNLDEEIKERILKEREENQFEFNKDKFMIGLESYYKKME